jgi:hypothetical protein
MPENLVDLFRRDREWGAPNAVARADLAQVHLLARRIRRRRHAAVTAAAATVVTVVALIVPALLGDRTSGTLPAVTDNGTARVTRSADGFLTLADLLRRDEPVPAARWKVEPIEKSTEPTPLSLQLPGCGGKSVDLPASTFRRRVWTGLTEPTTVNLAQTVALLDARTAETVDKAISQAQSCHLTDDPNSRAVLAQGPGVLVTGRASITLQPSQPPVISGPITEGTGYARAGDTLVVVQAYDARATNREGIPGQTAWLVDLAVRGLGRATGAEVAVPQPNRTALQAAAMAASPGNPAPPGMLTLADLGSDKRWTLSVTGPESLVDVNVSASIPTCGSAAFTMVRGKGTEQTYRATTPSTAGESRSFHSMVVERRITVPEADLATVRSALTALRSCRTVSRTERVLRSADGPPRVLIGERLDGDDAPAGEWHDLLGIVLTGRSFLWISSSVSQGAGPMPPQPGHVDWFDRLLPVAAQRAAE